MVPSKIANRPMRDTSASGRASATVALDQKPRRCRRASVLRCKQALETGEGVAGRERDGQTFAGELFLEQRSTDRGKGGQSPVAVGLAGDDLDAKLCAGDKRGKAALQLFLGVTGFVEEEGEGLDAGEAKRTAVG